ncbi:hypothetical protein [Nocardia grenadensis]|uniref:hypothetical protein n=1 Tax=Nocardia grenadensis TaxID=931537 RepID=UPI0007A40BA2|nr:hypothetical protein [Nocardia grenadensis]
MRLVRVSGSPYGLSTGPDGALWFTMAAEGALGRYLDGEVRTFPLGPSDGQPTVIVPAPGEAM